VANDFRAPEGSNPADLDAAVDGQLMAILDLRQDDSLAEEGLGREIVNRVQKLRKKAGLVAGDLVHVWLEMSPKLTSVVSVQVQDIPSVHCGVPPPPLPGPPTIIHPLYWNARHRRSGAAVRVRRGGCASRLQTALL